MENGPCYKPVMLVRLGQERDDICQMYQMWGKACSKEQIEGQNT